MNYSEHIALMKERCIKRLNIIKVLTHRSWRIGKEVLVAIYRSLVGSIVDYSFFALSSLLENNFKRLQAIQNKAMHSIFRLDFDSHMDQVFFVSGMPRVRDRLLDLNRRFLVSASVSNPLLLS